MLTLSGSLRVFLAIAPCDMRKSFDGLHAEVLARLGEDPRGGAVFTNRFRVGVSQEWRWDKAACHLRERRRPVGVFIEDPL